MDKSPAINQSNVSDWDRRGLPGWTYHNEALFELEISELFLTHWQIAGHVSDVAKTGDYLTFDVGSERSVVIRGDDGNLRAFHNLCRHRGSRVAIGDKGHCKNALAGAQGITGIDGATGAVGATGAQGVTGIDGATEIGRASCRERV